MNIRKDRGIVLSSKTVGEADIIAVILTREQGKKKFSFKGLKKSRKRPKSAAEPGTLLSLVYYHRENREISTVNEFVVENHPVSIREDMNRIFHLYFLLELTEKTIGYNDDTAIIFDLLESGISALAAAGNTANLPVFYTLHLLRFLGIIPSFLNCRSCGDETFTRFVLEVSDLSPVCGNCYSGSQDFLGVDTRDFINTSMTTRYSDIVHERFDSGEISTLLFNLILFVEHYYHISLKSKEFLTLKSSRRQQGEDSG